MLTNGFKLDLQMAAHLESEPNPFGRILFMVFGIKWGIGNNYRPHLQVLLQIHQRNQNGSPCSGEVFQNYPRLFVVSISSASICFINVALT
jgi:hypothetical protein